MELKGFVRYLNANALKGKSTIVPKGSVLTTVSMDLRGICELNVINNNQNGIMPLSALETWKTLGGPYMSLMGGTSHITKEDLILKSAIIANGVMAYKKDFDKVFGEDKGILFEKRSDELYILANPIVLWRNPLDKTSICSVDAESVPQLFDGSANLFKEDDYLLP